MWESNENVIMVSRTIIDLFHTPERNTSVSQKVDADLNSIFDSIEFTPDIPNVPTIKMEKNISSRKVVNAFRNCGKVSVENKVHSSNINSKAIIIKTEPGIDIQRDEIIVEESEVFQVQDGIEAEDDA